MTFPLNSFANNDTVTAPILNRLVVEIGDTTLGADTGSVTFSSIPQNFRHLKLVCYARVSDATLGVFFGLHCNGDTGSVNYTTQSMGATATSVSAINPTAARGIIGRLPGSTAAANLFAAVEVTFFNFADPTMMTTWMATSAVKAGTSTGNITIEAFGGKWRSVAALNSIQVYSDNGGNLVTGSRFTLLGLP